MRNPEYYALMGTLLTVLIIILINLIRERKRDEENIRRYMESMEQLRAERKAEQEKKRPRNKAQDAPKYAAGDDMDRLNRTKRNNDSSAIYLSIVIAILICIKILTK